MDNTDVVEQEVPTTPADEVEEPQYDPADVDAYLADKANWDKQQNQRLIQLGAKEKRVDELFDKVTGVLEKLGSAPAPSSGGKSQPFAGINAQQFAQELGVNVADYADRPSDLWREPVTLGQLYASINGITKWGDQVARRLYGDDLPNDPAEIVSITKVQRRAEEAFLKAASADSTLTDMLTQATIADLTDKHDMADEDDIRKAIDSFEPDKHGDFDAYIEAAAQASHEKFEGKLSSRAGAERTRRAKTPKRLRTASKGGGIPRGEKEPNPWTEDGMARVMADLRAQESFEGE